MPSCRHSMRTRISLCAYTCITTTYMISHSSYHVKGSNDEWTSGSKNMTCKNEGHGTKCSFNFLYLLAVNANLHNHLVYKWRCKLRLCREGYFCPKLHVALRRCPDKLAQEMSRHCKQALLSIHREQMKRQSKSTEAGWYQCTSLQCVRHC